MSDSKQTATGSHWAAAYIGKPYKLGGRGPTHYDCAGIVEKALREVYHVELPALPTYTAATMQQTAAEYLQTSFWVKADKPVDGAVVALSTNTKIHHIGIYIEVDRGVILHSFDKAGCIIQRPENMRNVAWNKLEYYIPKSWLTL